MTIHLTWSVYEREHINGYLESVIPTLESSKRRSQLLRTFFELPSRDSFKAQTWQNVEILLIYLYCTVMIETYIKKIDLSYIAGCNFTSYYNYIV